MADLADSRGILYPARLPTFHREPAPPGLDGLIRWFWIPRWDLPPGRTSRQEVLSFPASNLVVSPEGVALSGPTTRVSHRDLTGTSWAVGALLRPAALAALCVEPQGIRDSEVAFDAPDLHRNVAAAMSTSTNGQPDHTAARHAAVAAYTAWALELLPPPDETARLANAMEDLIANDREIRRVDQLADRLHLSPRAVQRLARRYVGVAPLAIIRRYRLQEAAQRLRDQPATTIAQVAAELGYADHAHLTGDFRTALGFTPDSYRRGSAHG